MENYWKCTGTLAKYDRPCPQKFLFFNIKFIKANGLDIDTIKNAVSIKCPRCGTIAGGVDLIV